MIICNTSTGKTRYCKIIGQVKGRENGEVYSIDKIFWVINIKKKYYFHIITMLYNLEMYKKKFLY